ncbi:monocarboxylate transporter 12-like [Haliotis rufescens]|uniref:monocarboxylate transporter 12-like n=1 Tax=Haliotis rufescens TaxID=6454 RepID=UPI00201F2963|nr:monocarboxylate transporter 12-like [Haliotis rufescens]
METGVDVDRGYAWVALGAALSIQLIDGIIIYSSGIFNIALMEVVENDITKVSWIGSTLIGSYTLLGPVAGMVQHRFGSKLTALAGGILTLFGMALASICRTITGLIFTYGFITGLGLCLGANVVGVVPGQYFKRRRSAAYGVCIAGGALGLFAAGPIARYLLDEYNLRGALLIMGGISFQRCIAASLFRKPTISSKRNRTTSKTFEQRDEEEHGQQNDLGESDPFHQLDQVTTEGISTSPCLSGNRSEERTDYIEARSGNVSLLCKTFKLVTQKSFLVYNCSIVLWSLGEVSAVFHLPNYVEQKGSSPKEAASLLSVMGAGDFFSRIVIGFLASDPRIEMTVIQVGLVGVAGLITILFPLVSHSYRWQIVFSFFYGLYNHVTNVLMGPIVIELTGLSNVALGFGIVYFFCGIGYLSGPVIASFIYQSTGIYDYTYVFAGTCLFLSSMTTAAISVFRTRVECEKEFEVK